jgi:hypothetical protein
MSLTWGGYPEEDWSHDDEREADGADEGVWAWRCEEADRVWIEEQIDRVFGAGDEGGGSDADR